MRKITEKAFHIYICRITCVVFIGISFLFITCAPETNLSNSTIAPTSITIENPYTGNIAPLRDEAQNHIFTITVEPENADDTVEWSIAENIGSITNGIYTRPASVPKDTSVTITAISTVAPNISATYTFTVKPENCLINSNSGFQKTENTRTIHVICTADELQAIDTNLDYRNGDDHIVGNFELGQDIDMTGIPNFDSIGDTTHNFIGSFDGKWYEIQNLNIDKRRNITNNNLGLFSVIDSPAEIKNVGVGGKVNGSDYVGGLVGFMNGGTVIGYNTATVSGNMNVGGLVGRMYNGTVVGYNTAVLDGTGLIGGLVGTTPMSGGSGGTVIGYNTGTVGINTLGIKGGLVGGGSGGVTVKGYTPPLGSSLPLVGIGGTAVGSNAIDITSATQATFSLFVFEDDPTDPTIKKQWQWVGNGQWPILSGMPLPQ